MKDAEDHNMVGNARMGSKSMMLIGISLTVFGVLLLVSPAAVGTAVVRLVAVVMLITGLAQLVHSLRLPGSVNSILSAALGLVVAGLGVMVWLNPEVGSGFLTALLMLFFVVNGLWKIVTAVRSRKASGWFWLFLSGLVSLLFVYLLWKQWPLAGAWAIGVLVGIDLLLSGVSMIVLAMTMRRIRTSSYVDTINL